MEGGPKQFATPEEEIAYLKGQIAARERDVLSRTAEADPNDLEAVGKQELAEYASFTPESVLNKDQRLEGRDMTESLAHVEVATGQVAEIMQIAQEKGIHNALSVLEKLDSPHLTDEVHRQLIEHIKEGTEVQDLKEGVPPWQILHMTLFEVTLPEHVDGDSQELAVKQLVSLMEQFYAGMQNVGHGSKVPAHIALEIAVSDKSDDIIFYVGIPTVSIELFEKQVLSLFPDAHLIEQTHDYNIFVEGGTSLVATAGLRKYPIYPLKNSELFESDPLSTLLNAFSKIEHDGGGASVQILIKPAQPKYIHTYKKIIEHINEGMKPAEAIRRSSFAGDLFEHTKDIFFSKKEKEGEIPSAPTVDADLVAALKEKIAQPIADTNIRIVVSAKDATQAEHIMSDIESTFHQFENTYGNTLYFKHPKGSALRGELKAFSFRQFAKNQILPLSHEELSLLMHFPGNGIASSPQFKQSRTSTAAAQNDMPLEGTLLGINNHRNIGREIFVTPEDRLRHFYIIGQTGTGKTTLMKNMIVQDIESGAGVCMIDPHGTDIEDVLGSVPPEREKDIIYFDPSRMDRVIGLNMLEFDESKPEQKTFVVNELFSIFQKLYGSVPESMGPMFEQYFRNATMLVLEDPASGSTLMDISRVLADAEYRRMKLSKATNPVVVQFWTEIAGKAGGEAALENIVPYITSKFDVFTANDFMRPIIGQQKSAFNFREIMDNQKILLVNLSKGRLGEINSNLIGMIFVGKLLMAALSRVDDPTKSFPPFYLHMDEFQNISTNSISAILSEARKYKMGLTLAHQFIAQLDEDIKDAVFGNVGSIAAFRVGAEDGQFLEEQFRPVFDVNDLINIPNRNAYIRMLANGTPVKPFSLQTLAPKEVHRERIDALIEQSYLTYGQPREEIEAEVKARYLKTKPTDTLRPRLP